MRYHQRLCLEAWHINSAYTPLNRDDGGLLPNAYLHLVKKKVQLISERIKGPIFAAFRSPLMKALDRSVETSCLWIVTSRLHSLNLYTRVASNHVWIISHFQISISFSHSPFLLLVTSMHICGVSKDVFLEVNE